MQWHLAKPHNMRAQIPRDLAAPAQGIKAQFNATIKNQLTVLALHLQKFAMHME